MRERFASVTFRKFTLVRDKSRWN